MKKPSRAEASKIYRAKKRSSGLCIYSGCHDAAAEGKASCPYHLALVNRQVKELGEWKKGFGYCRKCGCWKDKNPGNTLCKKHLLALRVPKKDRKDYRRPKLSKTPKVPRALARKVKHARKFVNEATFSTADESLYRDISSDP